MYINIHTSGNDSPKVITDIFGKKKKKTEKKHLNQGSIRNYTYLPTDLTSVHLSLGPGKEVVCKTRSRTYLT